MVYLYKYSKITDTTEYPVLRYPSDGGWEYHVASSISEWIVATIFCFYILSFTEEFRAIKMHHPVVGHMLINLSINLSTD